MCYFVEITLATDNDHAIVKNELCDNYSAVTETHTFIHKVITVTLIW